MTNTPAAHPKTCALIADGTMFDLAAPHFPGWRPIAQGLARQERFAGALTHRWSHADHALLMADLADPGCTDPETRFMALMHRIDVFAGGELTGPRRVAMNDEEQHQFEVAMLFAQTLLSIANAAGYKPPMHDHQVDRVIKANKQALFLEIEQLAPEGPGKDAMSWPADLPRPTPVPRLQPRTWDVSADMWEQAVVNTITEIKTADRAA